MSNVLFPTTPKKAGHTRPASLSKDCPTCWGLVWIIGPTGERDKCFVCNGTGKEPVYE